MSQAVSRHRCLAPTPQLVFGVWFWARCGRCVFCKWDGVYAKDEDEDERN